MLWNAIESKINSVKNQVAEELEEMGSVQLQSQWISDVEEISGKLRLRHEKIKEHAEATLRS